MKKALLLITCFCLFLSGALLAQEMPVNYFPYDPEKIYLFDVDLSVNSDGRLQITENITLNAQGQQIRRGIYRDIPFSLTEKITPVSLTMDGEKHHFFTEKRNDGLRINFGNDQYLPKGVHTYSLVYTFEGAIRFHKNYDELYWNVTGNYWDFPIDKARVHVAFPPAVRVRPKGISLYTGATGSSLSDARQVDSLTFETTHPLAVREGFTIAIPFDKGAILQPTWWKRLQARWEVWVSLGVLILLYVYFCISWYKVGRDPYLLAIPQYQPPQDISPAFLNYLKTGLFTSKTIACALLNLAMKGYITIEKDRKGSKTTLLANETDIDGLPVEEQKIMLSLFKDSNFLILDTSAAGKLKLLDLEMRTLFEQNRKEYVISNTRYLVPAIALLIILGIIPTFLLPNNTLVFLLFVNIHFTMFLRGMVVNGTPKNPVLQLLKLILLTLFYSVFWFASGVFSSPILMVCQSLFVVGVWGFVFYVVLIGNLTAAGQELFSQIAGFEKYIKIAEVYRVEASNPTETEQIFCQYLPFAFALGLENEWMRKFTRVLSQATLDKSMSCAGGFDHISHGLAFSIGSAMSYPGGSGSFGGGSSGGGSGGGGGGGR